MCNNPLQLLGAECVLFIAGAFALWYSFRVEAERDIAKRLFGKLKVGFIVDASDGWMGQNRRLWFYRICAYLITAFFWGLGAYMVVAFPRCV
jgi:hypothetical protein